MSDERLLSMYENGDDEESIRPSSLSEFVGQDSLKSNLSVFIKAAFALILLLKTLPVIKTNSSKDFFSR